MSLRNVKKLVRLRATNQLFCVIKREYVLCTAIAVKRYFITLTYQQLCMITKIGSLKVYWEKNIWQSCCFRVTSNSQQSYSDVAKCKSILKFIIHKNSTHRTEMVSNSEQIIRLRNLVLCVSFFSKFESNWDSLTVLFTSHLLFAVVLGTLETNKTET